MGRAKAYRKRRMERRHRRLWTEGMRQHRKQQTERLLSGLANLLLLQHQLFPLEKDKWN
jgi:hypothetical protein